MKGGVEFNEVFFDGARTPAENIVGQRGEGWKVSRATLKHERKLIGNPSSCARLFDGVRRARAARRARRPAGDRGPGVRRRLAEIEGYVRAQEYTNLRMLTASARAQF